MKTKYTEALEKLLDELDDGEFRASDWALKFLKIAKEHNDPVVHTDAGYNNVTFRSGKRRLAP